MHYISVNASRNSIENDENGDVYFLPCWELHGWASDALTNHRQVTYMNPRNMHHT